MIMIMMIVVAMMMMMMMMMMIVNKLALIQQYSIQLGNSVKMKTEVGCKRSGDLRIDIPDGLSDLLRDFTVAVLQNRPQDLLQFASKYFSLVLGVGEIKWGRSRVAVGA